MTAPPTCNTPPKAAQPKRRNPRITVFFRFPSIQPNQEPDGRAIPPRKNRKRRPGILGKASILQGRESSRAREVLLPFDVSLSFPQAAHGACAQLHHRRCALALRAHERQESVATDGVGC